MMYSGMNAGDPGIVVEAGIEAQDSGDAVMFHIARQNWTCLRLLFVSGSLHPV
jgi:hypothetical protein